MKIIDAIGIAFIIAGIALTVLNFAAARYSIRPAQSAAVNESVPMITTGEKN